MRNSRADFYKGLLMIGVVWGHLITCFLHGETNNIGIHWIMRTYDMPFFMVISGYFMSNSVQKYSLNILLLNKITTLLLPTIIWSFFLVMFQKINFNSYYFLYAVFWSSCIVAITDKLVKNKIFRLIIYSVIALSFYFIDMPLANLSYLFPFYIMGHYGYMMGDYRKIMFLMLPVFIFLLCFWSIEYTIWEAGDYLPGGGWKLFRIILFRLLIALVGIITIKNIFDIIYDFQVDSKLRSFIIKIGTETLGIYLLHVFIIRYIIRYMVNESINIYGMNVISINDSLLGYFITPIFSLLLCGFCYVVIKQTKRNKYTRYIWGGKLSDFSKTN